MISRFQNLWYEITAEPAQSEHETSDGINLAQKQEVDNECENQLWHYNALQYFWSLNEANVSTLKSKTYSRESLIWD